MVASTAPANPRGWWVVRKHGISDCGSGHQFTPATPRSCSRLQATTFESACWSSHSCRSALLPGQAHRSYALENPVGLPPEVRGMCRTVGIATSVNPLDNAERRRPLTTLVPRARAVPNRFSDAVSALGMSVGPALDAREETGAEAQAAGDVVAGDVAHLERGAPVCRQQIQAFREHVATEPQTLTWVLGPHWFDETDTSGDVTATSFADCL